MYFMKDGTFNAHIFWVNCMTSHEFYEIKKSYKYFVIFRLYIGTMIMLKSMKRPPRRSINFSKHVLDKGGFLRLRDGSFLLERLVPYHGQ